MTCTSFQETVSARLEGEPTGTELVSAARVVTPRRLGAALAAGLLAVLVLLVLASPASAHAVLQRSDPAPGTVLHTAPAAVTLTFDEAVTALPTSLRVFAPDGSRVDDGTSRHPGGTGEQVEVGLRDSAVRGTYLVSWRVVSADSHPVAGTFTFAVGARSATPTPSAEDTDRTVAVGLGISRFVGYGSIALLAGGVVFLAIAWPGGRRAQGSRLLLLVGAAGLTLSSGAALLLKGPYDAALGLGSIGQGDLLRETVSTTYGRGMMARFFLAFLSVAVLVDARRLARRQGTVLAVLAAALVATFPVTGHAVAGDQRAVALTSDLVHVMAMSVWLGGLAMLVVALMRSPPAEAAPVVRTFSRMALLCVLLVVSTGTYQAWREVRAWGALTHTTYGRVLLVKIGLVAGILVAAWFSRAWVRRSSRGDGPEGVALPRLRRSVGAEAVIAVAVLGLTSALVATEPARAAYHPSVAAELGLGPDTVHLTAVPSGDRTMTVQIHVVDRSHQPTDPAEVRADAVLTEHGIGPLPLTLHHVGTGHEVGRLSVPVPGDWTLTVRVRTSAFDEYAKALVLPIR